MAVRRIRPRLVESSGWSRPAAVVLALVLAVVPAQAEERRLAPSVLALVGLAEKSYQEGQFDRASELFEQAWRAATAESTLLYNAARAAQMARQWDRAEQLYGDYLAGEGQDPKFLAKAQRYLVDVRLARVKARANDAEQKAKVAGELQAAGRYREAAAAYRDAFRLDGTRFDYTLQAGLTLALACDEAAARLYLEQYLQLAPSDAADRPEASVRLQGLAASCRNQRPTQSDPDGAGPPAIVGKAQPTGSGAMVGVLTAVGGVLLASVGGTLYGMASADDTALQKALHPPGGELISEYTPTTAAAAKASIEGRLTAGAVLLGVGGATAAAGVVIWALAGDNPPVVATLKVTPGGLTFAFRY